MDSSVVWKQGMAFDASLEGHSFVIDASEEHGGEGLGPTPKPLVLTALAGCTAMDVISILRKMSVAPSGFSVTAETTLTEQHPRVFEAVTVTYRFEGEGLPTKKLRRAVELSETRYCGVSAMLGKATTILSAIHVNGELLEESAPPG